MITYTSIKVSYKDLQEASNVAQAKIYKQKNNKGYIRQQKNDSIKYYNLTSTFATRVRLKVVMSLMSRGYKNLYQRGLRLLNSLISYSN